jgi:hypothetical protein
MNRHRRAEAKRARRAARIGNRHPGKHAERQAALMLKGQENWSRATGVRFPIHIGLVGVPHR